MVWDVEGSASKNHWPVGSIVKDAAIVANRHIHISSEMKERLGLTNIEKVSLRVLGEKRTILQDVYLKEQNPAYFEVHLDTDDGNACQLKSGDILEIITEEL